MLPEHCLVTFGIFAALLSGVLPAGAQNPGPDAVTVTSNEDVELCRLKGHCYIPEVDDPIFIGDVIETGESGRIEFLVSGLGSSPDARVLLLPDGKIRIDRGSTQFVEIEILHGMIAVEPMNDFDVTFGSMRCLLGPGAAALGYDLPDEPAGSAFVTNVRGSCRCLSAEDGTYDIPVDTAFSFRNGRSIHERPAAEGLWATLTGDR